MEERGEATLVEKCLSEEAVLEGFEDLGCDASAQIHAAGGEDFERDVAGFGAVGADEGLHSLKAKGAGAVFRTLADDGVGILGLHAVAQPWGSSTLFDVAKELVDVPDAETGDDALPADATLECAAKIFEESDLAIGTGREITVAAFGGDGAVPLAVPDEECLAEACSSGDETVVADGGTSPSWSVTILSGASSGMP